jgi:hypothetical protein
MVRRKKEAWLHHGIELWRSLLTIKKAQLSQGKATAPSAQHRSVRSAQLRFSGSTSA